MVRIYFCPFGRGNGKSAMVSFGFSLKEACLRWLASNEESCRMLFSDYEKETGESRLDRFEEWCSKMSGDELFERLRDGRYHWYVDDKEEENEDD